MSERQPAIVLRPSLAWSDLLAGQLRGADKPRIEFFDDRFVVHEMDGRTIDGELADIGHVQFFAPGTITVAYGMSRPNQRAHTDVKVSRLVAEDRFDEIVAHFEAHAPEHLFSTFERFRLRHSHPWRLDVLLGIEGQVARAAARVVSTEPARLVFEVGEARFDVHHEHGFVLRRAGEAEGRPLVQVFRSQFFRENGMVLGVMPDFASFAFGVDSPGGESWIAHEALREVHCEGRRIGAFRGARGNFEVEFDQPVDAAQAALFLLAATQRQLVPGASAAIGEEPEPASRTWTSSAVVAHWRLIAQLTIIGTYGLVMILGGFLTGGRFGWASAMTMLMPAMPVFFLLMGTRKRVTEALALCGDRVLVWQNLAMVGARLLLAPHDVGHFSRGRFGAVQVWFAVPDVDQRTMCPLVVFGRFEETRDEVIQGLTEMSDRFVCSIEEDEGQGKVRYSRAWTLAELLPWQQEVRRAELHPGRGSRAELVTPSGSFPVVQRFGYSVFLPGSAADVLLAKVEANRLYLHNGMVLGFTMEGTRVRFGSGEDVTIDRLRGLVQVDGVDAGRLGNDGTTLVLELDAPRPELFFALVLLAFADGS